MKWSTDRRACRQCLAHRALFFTHRHRIRWDRDHTLCVRCFRSTRDHVRVVRVNTVPILGAVA